MKFFLRYIETYKQMSIVKKSVIWYTIAAILQKAIAFMVTPLYTRILTDAQYGLYSVYQTWLQLVSVIAVVALDRCMTVGFMKYEEDRKGFLSSIQLLMTFTTAMFLVVVLGFKKIFLGLFGLSQSIVTIMFIVALLQNAVSNWTWYQRYTYNYRKLTFFSIVFSIVSQGAALFAVLGLPGFNKGEILIFSIAAITIVIYGFVYINVFLNGKKGYKKDYWAFAIPYSISIMPHALAQIVLSSSDRIMIDKLCGRTDAAHYSVTYSAAMVLNTIMMSANSAIQPWFFEKIKDKNFSSIDKMVNVYISVIAAIAVIVSAFAPELLMLLAPSSYQSAAWIFPAVAVSVFYYALFLCFANFESYYEKPIYFSVATITGAVVNVILNFVFIPAFGYIAAGYTTLVCYMLFALMHYIFMRKVCKEKIGGVKIFNIRFIVGLSVTLTISSVGVTVLYSHPVLRYGILSVISASCLIKRKVVICWIKSRLE